MRSRYLGLSHHKFRPVYPTQHPDQTKIRSHSTEDTFTQSKDTGSFHQDTIRFGSSVPFTFASLFQQSQGTEMKTRNMATMATEATTGGGEIGRHLVVAWRNLGGPKTDSIMILELFAEEPNGPTQQAYAVRDLSHVRTPSSCLFSLFEVLALPLERWSSSTSHSNSSRSCSNSSRCHWSSSTSRSNSSRCHWSAGLFELLALPMEG